MCLFVDCLKLQGFDFLGRRIQSICLLSSAWGLIFNGCMCECVSWEWGYNLNVVMVIRVCPDVYYIWFVFLKQIPCSAIDDINFKQLKNLFLFKKLWTKIVSSVKIKSFCFVSNFIKSSRHLYYLHKDKVDRMWFCEIFSDSSSTNFYISI